MFCKTEQQRSKEPKHSREELVLGSVNIDPEMFSTEIVTQIGVSKSEGSHILRKHKYHSCRMYISQELIPADYPKRQTSCNWYLQKVHEDEDFHNKILRADKSYFASNGCFNHNSAQRYLEVLKT